MAAQPLELPAFLQVKYRDAGVFSTLKSEAASASGEVRKSFAEMAGSVERSFATVAGSSRQALTSIGTGDLARSLELQKARAAAAEEYAGAARRAATADAGQSRELQQAAAAAEAMAAREREATLAAALHADVIGRVTTELNRETGGAEGAIAAYRRLASANDNGTKSAGGHRMAMVGLGQQLQDSVIQLQMGTSALTVFAQQGSQAAFQMAGMGGKVGAVASVLAGPLGAALFGGTALLGPLIAGLFKASDALDEVKFASDGVTTAQGILGNVMDLTTGKVTTQRGALLALAEAQILVNRVQAQQRAAEARRGVLAIQDRPVRFTGGGLGGGFSAGRRPVDARDTISQDVLAGTLDAKTAVERLDNLRKAGRLTADEFNQAAAAVANLNLELENIKSFDKADQLLNGRGGRDLLKPAKATKPKVDHSAERAAREAERVKRFSDQAAESVARITERFDAAPKAIDQAAQATRKLDDVIADIDARLAKGGVGKQVADDLAKARAEAEAAKQTIADSLVRPLEDARRESEQRLAVQSLLAQGRDDEAAGLQAVYALEQQLGEEEVLRAKVAVLTAAGRKDEATALQSLLDRYPEMKRQTAEIAEIEAQRSRELERQQKLFDAQIAVLDTARGDLTSILSGRKADLLGDLKQSLQDLSGARLADQLFGSVFNEIEDQLRQRSPLGKATSRLVNGVDTASGSVRDLASATSTAADEILRSARRLASANDNPTDPSLIDGNDIIVTGTRLKSASPAANRDVELARMSVQQLADKTAHGIVDPLTAKLDALLGTRFFQGLNGVLSGALGGYMTGGATGGILGGLKGAVFDYGPDIFGKSATESILGGLDKGIGGAATGTQMAGIMKSLGLKTSTTGAQIGGAIGSFLPIPGGDIIGSIAGGIIGGMFKKTRWARVLLSNGGSELQSNSGKYEDAVTGAGKDFTDSLKNIADQLGGTLGDFGSITLGVRHGDWRVNTGGTSLKVKKGAQDFNDDAEAAMKYALMQAIDRGAIAGIKASTQRLLKAGDDLDAALKDALDWENAFKELKSIKDPIGAALDDLNQQFAKLIDLGGKAGASAQEMADLEELYGIKRAEIIKDTNEKIIGSLKGLYSDLTVGDNGLSLRDREAAALAVYQPLADRVAAGDTTAYDDYAQAARDLLDIERALYGSQQEYFDRLNQVTDLTKTRIDAETNVTSIADDRGSPFDNASFNSTISSQTAALSEVFGSHLDALNANVGATNAALARIEGALAANGTSLGRLAFKSSF